MTAPTVASMLGFLLIIPVTCLLFGRLEPTKAAFYSVMIAILFGPGLVFIEIPFSIPISKEALACLCAFIGLVVACPGRVRAAKLFGSTDVLLVAMIVGGAVSVLLNRDVLRYGEVSIAGFGFHHVILRALISDLLYWATPYWIGRICFRTPQDARGLVLGFAGFAMAYVPCILVELRMSPQMNYWVYGFAQSSFLQTVRAGGYRPMVFMAHGLALAMFLFVSASLIWSARKCQLRLFGFSPQFVAIALGMLLVAVKSVGALVFLLLMFAFTWLFSARGLLRVAMVVALLAIAYPMMRATDTFPTRGFVSFVAGHSAERAQSLEFRFDNEDILLAKALQRPWFGWGGNGRGRVYDEDGNDVSVTDGAWIIHFGERGIVGFVVRFGLLLYPIWRALRRFKRFEPSMQTFVAGLAVTLVLSVVDQIPNGAFNVIPIILAGALVGIADPTNSSSVPQTRSNALRVLLLHRLLASRSTRSGATSLLTDG